MGNALTPDPSRMAAGTDLRDLLAQRTAELERLKQAASFPLARLELRENLDRKEHRIYRRYLFDISTGVRNIGTTYKTYMGDEAPLNPIFLNDWGSGYGILNPRPFWYASGFIDITLKNSGGSCAIMPIQGQPFLLKQQGNNVAYDLQFTLSNGQVIIRTAALVGREELFISVYGTTDSSGQEARLQVSFRAYPLGFTGPFDRWVHTCKTDFPNDGKKKKTLPVDLETESWALLTDHTLNKNGKSSGQLGLIWNRGGVDSVRITHSGNYAILSEVEGRTGTSGMQFIVCDFDAMTWQDARKKLKILSQEAGSLFSQAFSDLPLPTTGAEQ